MDEKKQEAKVVEAEENKLKETAKAAWSFIRKEVLPVVGGATIGALTMWAYTGVKNGRFEDKSVDIHTSPDELRITPAESGGTDQ